MVKSKKFVRVEEYSGIPKVSDFKIVEEELGELKDGGKKHFILSPLPAKLGCGDIGFKMSVCVSVCYFSKGLIKSAIL